MWRRVLGLAALVAVVSTTTASAAVAPVFSRSSAHWGDRVGVVQPVRIADAAPGADSGVTVYLVSLARAEALSGVVSDGPPSRALAADRLGELVTDRNGYWRLSFSVPRVRPGAYATLVWCKPCRSAAYPHGSVFAGGYLARRGVLHVSR